jgi:glycosyltransferase involved in cell wall biosynthesis
VGGAERVVAELVEEGAARGWDQLVLNPFALDPWNSELAGLVAPADYRGRVCSRLGGVPGLALWLRGRLRDFEPNIVHAHLFHAGVATAAAGPRLPGRYVLTHHHGDSLVYERRRVDVGLDRLAGWRYDRVVAISRSVYEFLRSRYRYPADKLVLVPNGWSGDPRPEPGLANHPTVISVARFRAQKGHADLLSAFAIVVREIPQARLLLVGDGKLAADLRRRVNSLRLGENVEFCGAIDDVWPVLAEAHVFALASLYEPLGIAVLEAMAAGLPVVATAVGGIPELVEDGQTGRLVAPHAPDQMAAALVDLLDSPDARASMGAAGRERAKEFTTSRAIGRYFGLYDELVNR